MEGLKSHGRLYKHIVISIYTSNFKIVYLTLLKYFILGWSFFHCPYSPIGGA